MTASREKWLKGRARGQKVLNHLYSAFPSVFIKQGDCKALQERINDSIAQVLNNTEVDDLRVTEQDVSLALSIYTHTIRYNKACQEGVDRYDLNGDKTGVKITATQADWHKSRLVTLKEAIAKRRRKQKLASNAKKTELVRVDEKETLNNRSVLSLKPKSEKH